MEGDFRKRRWYSDNLSVRTDEIVSQDIILGLFGGTATISRYLERASLFPLNYVTWTSGLHTVRYPDFPG